MVIGSFSEWLFGDAVSELEGLHFAFNVPFDQALAWALLALLGLVVGVWFWRRFAALPFFSRSFLTGFRILAALLVLFLALDPCLVGKRIRPADRLVLMLFDDSKSMQVAGADRRTRGKRLLERYRAEQQNLEQQLRNKSRLVMARFGESFERLRGLEHLSFEQNESDVTGAVKTALSDFTGTQIAAAVVFSDGAQSAGLRPDDWQELERLQVPVYTIGVGDESAWRDLEMGELAVRHTDFEKQPVIVNAPVMASGLAGEQVVVEALVNGSVVATHRLPIQSQEETKEARLEFIPPESGWLEVGVRARIAAAGDGEESNPPDRISQNNSRRFLLDNRDKTYRILYLGGRPNWENKFIRRAMEADDQLKLTSLIRISGPEKTFTYRGRRSSIANPIFEGIDVERDVPRYDEALFLRFGAKESELSEGYPDTEEELFPYDLVIWGEIEAEFFSQEQLKVTREFVRKRGGGLMLLGGRHSFSEGGFSGTIIESMLPARLLMSGRSQSFSELAEERAFAAQPTTEGTLSGAWVLDPDPQSNRRTWRQMPALYRVNEFAMMRPGATVYAEAIAEDGASDSRPLYAVQRYGEGRCAILASGSTWQWQMRAEEGNRNHERLWRQLVRGLSQEAAEPVRLRNPCDRYIVGDPVPFEFIIRDKSFNARERLDVSVTIKAPSGQEAGIPVEESIRQSGLYATEHNPSETGMHIVSLNALDEEGKQVGSTEQAFVVEADRREFQNARYNPEFLRNLAGRTGGSFLPLDQLSQLPDLIKWRPSEQAEEGRIHLWKFPGFYFLLAFLMIVEWFLRRKKGYR